MTDNFSNLDSQIPSDDEFVESERKKSVELEEEDKTDVSLDLHKWYTQRSCTPLKRMKCDHIQILTVKGIHDLAAQKQIKTSKQLILIKMFDNSSKQLLCMTCKYCK